MTTNQRCSLSVAALFVTLAATVSFAQDAETTNAQAPLVVDGVIRQIFNSSRDGRTDYLVEIDVQRSEARPPRQGTVTPQYPAPGQSVYVHVSRPQARVAPGARDLPQEKARVRAYLVPRTPGGWEGASAEWFEIASDRTVQTRPADAAPARPTNGAPAGDDDRMPLTSLGITTEPIRARDRFALRVTSIERGGPGQKAGLEIGDVIVAADGELLTSAKQLADVAARGAEFPLVVLDVNTGRPAQVEIRAAARPGDLSQGPRQDPAATPRVEPSQKPARSLGVSAEPVSLGGRTALKISRVEPDSPAARAGLEPDDVIVAAGGAQVTGVEQLVSAIRKSGPTLALTVRDSRTGKDTDVKIAMGGVEPATPLPNVPADVGGGADVSKLGAVVELAFHNDDFAVKVSEVEPGSPAERAGLRPGMIITEANRKPVLHPTDLDAALQAGGQASLTIVDPRTGKKSAVEVRLAR